VNVRSDADQPASFLNETQKLPPDASWRGWVTFDGRVTGMVPASLDYIDGKQTLRQTFEGMHSVVLASG
jgi:phage terminase large subunit-like protein